MAAMGIICLTLLACLGASIRAQMIPSTCNGTWNTKPILTDLPRFLRSVPNGKLYLADGVEPPIRIVHVWGSHTEMGVALGQLLREEIPVFIERMVDYIDTLAAGFLKEYLHWPEEVSKAMVRRLLFVALRATRDLTRPYTPHHFDEEIEGIARGAAMSEDLLLDFNQFPELVKSACTIIGAWGSAVAKGETLLQVRGFDWATDTPLNDYPTVVVYHPDPSRVPGSQPFLTFGYPGFVGALTGYSSAPMGLSHKYWNHNAYNGSIAVAGYPFDYLLRDVLEFDVDLSAALTRIYNARRTCPVYVGLGDAHLGESGQMRTLEYSHDYVNVYSDHTYPLYPGHPRIDSTVYITKDPQPDHNPCLAQLLQIAHGSLTAPMMINITAAHGSGTTHATVYDFAAEHVYVASSSSASRGPVVPAALRSYVRLEARALFNEPRPSNEHE